jgi:hypothetical protein
MRKILGTLILLLAGIIAYMYFFGKDTDKETAHHIVSETKDLGKSVGDFIKRQTEKYDNGEFDILLEKISRSINKLKSKTENNSDEVKDDLLDLEKELKQIDPEKLSEENRDDLKRILEDLDKELK